MFSAYGEINAPIVDMVTRQPVGSLRPLPRRDRQLLAEGRRADPLRSTSSTLRGTHSRGFRIPSFGEADATFPTTGYVSATSAIYTDFFLNRVRLLAGDLHHVPGLRSGYVGRRHGGLWPDLAVEPRPEAGKVQSWTTGIVLEPLRGVHLSAEYYSIKKTDVITTANNAPAILAYYSGEAIPEGYTVVPDAADVNHPDALPRIAFVQSGFINANTLKTSGLDFAVDVSTPISDNIRFTTNAEATYIIKLEMEFPDGTVERYDGTIGNYNLTAGSGTPKWKGTWTSALEFGDQFTVAGTLNYFDGYDLSAMDQGTGYKDCGMSDGTTRAA